MYRIILVSVFLFFTASAIFSQTSTGVIDGVVIDANGAVVPGALVKATLQTDKNVSEEKFFTDVTDDDGKFKFTNLPFGIYEIALNALGMTGKKRVEVKDGAPQAKEIIQLKENFEVCSESHAKGDSDSVADKDKGEIVRQMLKIAFEDDSKLFSDGSEKSGLILSTKNIKSEWLNNAESKRFVLMKPKEIQKRADRQGDFMYLVFSELKVKGQCVEVSFDKIWAVGKSSGMGYLSGGGMTYKFTKVDGRWVGKAVIGWIA